MKNDAGAVAACQAINAKTGIVFMAAGDRVLLFAQPDKLPFAGSAVVKGTWAVDGSKPLAFTSGGGGANLVACDVPNTAEAVAALTSGKRLDLTAGNIKASFDLTGTAVATCATAMMEPFVLFVSFVVHLLPWLG